MDSYLSIAQSVLRLARRPLSAREIVEMAFRHDLVPSQLYGKTQQKTLGSRLSVDILTRRDRSLFYRTQPGKFFLREFLADPALPSAYRSPIIARRRQRELRRGAPLAVSRETAEAITAAFNKVEDKLQVILDARFYYPDPAKHVRATSELYVWSFVMFMRGSEVLTYRHGRYREGRDTFLKRRSVGFFTPVVDKDLDLFDEGDHGIVSSGVRAITVDLDLSPTSFQADIGTDMAKIVDLVIAQGAGGNEDLLAVVAVDCPRGFEPLTRRLAINDLRWMRLDVPVNHVDDFDPWSQVVVQRAQERSGKDS